MPTNITQGDRAEFIAEFLDANLIPVVPASATLTITYPVGTTIASTVIAMTLNNTFYTGIWNSGVSSFGIANWVIVGLGSSLTTVGQLNIIDP